MIILANMTCSDSLYMKSVVQDGYIRKHHMLLLIMCSVVQDAYNYCDESQPHLA